MLTEDEDHGEVITNLLEDKALPRTPNRAGSGAGGRRGSNSQQLAVNQRSSRCDKPFCCHNNENGSATNCGGSSGIYLDSTAYNVGGGLTRTLSSKYYRRRPSQNRLLPPTSDGSGGGGQLDSAVGSGSGSTGSSVTSLNHTNNNNNFGRSNSFRLHRPVPSAASTYSSYLSYQPAVLLVDRKAASSNTNNNNNNSANTCKHIQYCCLHQQRDGSFFQATITPGNANTSSTLSLNERTTTTTNMTTGRMLPISPAGPSRVTIGQQQQQNRPNKLHQHQQHQHHHTQDGINFSDDEKKSLIYPQLTTADRYGQPVDLEVSGMDSSGNSFQQQKQRYSLLTKSYDQINRSRIFGEC